MRLQSTVFMKKGLQERELNGFIPMRIQNHPSHFLLPVLRYNEKEKKCVTEAQEKKKKKKFRSRGQQCRMEPGWK